MTYLKLFSTGLLSLLFSLSAAAQIDCSAGSAAVANIQLNPGAPNSNLNPDINQRHVFCGEVNGGQATGYHARPGGHDPILAPGQLAARVTGNLTASNLYQGVYRGAGIQVRQAVGGAWFNKQQSSTFFPDTCSQAEVVASIRYAYGQDTLAAGGPFEGPSAPNAGSVGHCTGDDDAVLRVQGFLNFIGGRWILNTAYPRFN